MSSPGLRILSSDEVELPQAGSYKSSIYNHFVERDDVVWGINFRSTALIRFTPEQYRKVQQILSGEHQEGNGKPPQGLRGDLIKAKFLIPEALDEIQLLKARNRAARFGIRGLTLIVAPTLRCNFDCDYCYVDLNANKMSPEARARTAKFFDHKVPQNASAMVVWTGGDPSLAMDVVEDLSLNFIASCERKGSTYRANLITNGYLLDDKMRQHLRRSHIKHMQISLDGSREFHDRLRCLPNKKPTYETILRNVEDSCDEFEIYLRINVDKNNFANIPDLLDDLDSRNLTKRLFIYFAHVDDVNENSAAHHESCLVATKYAQVEAKLVRDAMQRGFRIGGRLLTRAVDTFCGANSMNYYVIDSSANLLKCYHDFGKADKLGIGRIGDDGSEVVTNPYNLLKWLGWDPFEIEECKGCKVLPQCMGGCSHKIMNSNMEIERGCLKLRFTMDEIVELVGEQAVKRRAAETPGCFGRAETEGMNV